MDKTTLNLYRLLYLNRLDVVQVLSKPWIEPIQIVVFKSVNYNPNSLNDDLLNLYRLLYLNRSIL